MSAKELHEAVANKDPFIIRKTDSIAVAEEWFRDNFEVFEISDGKIFMRKGTEDALLCWKMQNDAGFKEKIMKEKRFRKAEIYKGKMP